MEARHQQRRPAAPDDRGQPRVGSDGSGNFVAYDARNGEPLWHAGLKSAPSNAPITYMLDGHQYVLVAGGENLYAFRYAYGGSANTLYYRETGHSVVVVSEPLDMDREFWKPVPPGHLITSRPGKPVLLEPFPQIARLAAE